MKSWQIIDAFNSFTGFHLPLIVMRGHKTADNFQFLHRIPLFLANAFALSMLQTFQFLHRIPLATIAAAFTRRFIRLSIPSPDSTGLTPKEAVQESIFQFLHRIPRTYWISVGLQRC